jgi:hypothetical protein
VNKKVSTLTIKGIENETKKSFEVRPDRTTSNNRPDVRFG